MTMAVRNILKVFRLATENEVHNGTVWYGIAQHEAANIAYAFDLPIRIVVGVIAALSPNNKWERNITNASDMIAVYLRGGDVNECKPSTYLKMRDKAWSILQQMPATDDDVIKILNGQKIVSFFRNILGHDTCTVDGHAFNIANGKRIGLTDPEVNISKGQYRELQNAYSRAGKRVGLKSYQIQAITWVAWKRMHNI